MRQTIRRIRRTTITAALAVAAAVALGLIVDVSGALAAGTTAATGAGAGAGAGGQDLMSLANNAGTDFHTIALRLIEIAMGVTALVTIYLHKWKLLLSGMAIAIGAFLFVNGGAAGIANGTANKLGNVQASQVQGGSGSGSGIPGVTGP